MSAVVMPCYSSPYQVHHWMLAQMSDSTYPPPPSQQQQQYNVMYPSSTSSNQPMLDGLHQELQYSNLNQPIYPKTEAGTSDQNSATSEIQRLAVELQQQAQQEELRRQQGQHAAQLQPTGQQAQHTGYIPASNNLPLQPAGDSAPKNNRLRKACDSCSVRKVKCDETGPPCRACTNLDIPCTFDRPSRRRGPPNRHAEAIKRRRMEEFQYGSSPEPSPSSPARAAEVLPTLSANTSMQQLSAKSICPIETLDALIDDFFTYIHPLCPFPHEPSFREAWKRRQDIDNKPFLALLAAMIGALVASFPRKPRLHLKAQKRDRLFPNHVSLVDRCRQVCTLARGPGYLESDSLSVYDAATSYFLGLMGTYTFRWRQGRVYFSECLTILRALGFHKPEALSNDGLGNVPTAVGSQHPSVDADGVVDNITVEMGRRIFWTMFVTAKSTQQLGASFAELIIPPSTPNDPYPLLPTEVDDFCIYPGHIERQPEGLLPMIAGFNANVKMYSAYNPLSTMELAWGIDAVVDWNRQKRVLRESLRRCKDSVSGLPEELVVKPTVDAGEVRTSAGLSLSRDPAAALSNNLTSREQLDRADQSPEERRRMQYEIQKANIYASSLSTRSYIVEKYWNLCNAYDRARSQTSGSRPGSLPGSMPSSPGMGITAAGIDNLVSQAPTSNPDETDQEMRDERESIIKDLLIVLSSINQVNMEPNGDSFTMKIRTIASTLLDAPDERKGPIALSAQEYLAAFLDILMKLERVSPANSDPDHPADEDAELRQWANLREYQRKFAQQGGMLGLS